LPDTLPRVTEVIASAACACAECGGETTIIGYDESEQTGCRAGALFRTRDEAREAGLPAVLDAERRAAG
jgi:transposase